MPDTAPDPRPPLPVVAAVDARPDTEMIVRVQDAGDLLLLRDLDPARIAWLEVPLALAARPELDRFSVDVVIHDPQTEARELYALARVRDGALPRLSIPSKPGFGRAASIGMALHFPMRLIAIQPAPALVQEMREALDRYLHDSHAAEPVEPFHSALATLIHGTPTTAWEAMEQDPAIFRRDPPAVDSVPAHLQRLVESGAQCATCPVQAWCAGWFKWPDPAYDCSQILPLFEDLERAARQLQADLNEAREVIP